MFRYEVGAKILVKRRDWDEVGKTIEVKVLNKAPNRIKVKVLSDGWFRVGEVHWLSNWEWFSVGRSSY